MNVIITGSYDNTVVVDTNLFEDVKLLQTLLKKGVWFTENRCMVY